MHRLSGTAWLIAIAAVSAAFARVEGGRLPYFMLYLAIAALAHALAQALAVNGLAVSRRLSHQRCFAGQAIELHTEVRNTALWPLPAVEVRSAAPARVVTDGPTSAVFGLGPRRTAHLRQRFVPARRGLYRWDDVQVRTADPLGVGAHSRRFRLAAELLVYPRTAWLPDFAAAQPRAHGQTQQKRRTPEDSDLLLGIRDYADGDGLSRVHWKVSARFGELKSKEFARPGAGDALVAVDLDRRFAAGDGDDTVEEMTVEAAASLCRHFLAAGRRTGLVVAGRRLDVVPVVRGPEHLHRLLAALATAATGGEPCLPAALAQARALPPGSSVVLVTAASDVELARGVLALRAHGHRVAIVHVDRASFLPGAAGSGAASGPDLLRRLREFGAAAVPLRRGDDLSSVLGGLPRGA